MVCKTKVRVIKGVGGKEFTFIWMEAIEDEEGKGGLIIKDSASYY